jgi:chromosome segregation ATPase
VLSEKKNDRSAAIKALAEAQHALKDSDAEKARLS